MDDKCETAITTTGWGLCNYFLIVLCGMCTLAEAGASLTVPIIVPLLTCDLKLNKNTDLTLNAMLLIGMAAGGFVFGTLSDMNGRKGSIPVTMVVIFCASVGLSFAQTYFFINLSIFILGVGVAGSNAVLRVYLIECLPAKRRGSSLVIIDLLWIIGYMSALGISWSLVPSVVRMLGNEFRPSSWRVLAGLGGAPALIMACASSLLPPSPRYLLYRRHPEQALAVLQQIYAVNYSRHGNNYPPCELDGCIETEEESEEHSRTMLNNFHRYFIVTIKRIMKIFKQPLRRITLLGLLTSLLLFPGFTWLALWDSHVLQETSKGLEMNPLKDDTSCVADSGILASGFLKNCHQVNDARFKYFLLMSLSYILGEIFLVLGIDIVGRKLLTISSGLIGGTALLTFVFASRYVTRVVLSIFILASYAINYTSINIAILENYPTSVRCTVIGVMRILPHVAGFFMRLYMKMSCLSTIYIMSGLIIGATITAIPIPDLTKLPMQE
ncbi:organic cation/carnitine transporter 7 [Cephus cinctus]|uniref:Organic cation/carnitine transporter 7 n=1 Tax=Cephus cinctus TaxID=211228 RepID=A0AAJ7RDT1_CEPCN|nr:organic cation/carnitine transporter 7 [Cephus cinctus]XP_024939056.1 organic cation/carnitine transporter 7 [Cephus cinctus]